MSPLYGRVIQKFINDAIDQRCSTLNTEDPVALMQMQHASQSQFGTGIDFDEGTLIQHNMTSARPQQQTKTDRLGTDHFVHAKDSLVCYPPKAGNGAAMTPSYEKALVSGVDALKVNEDQLNQAESQWNDGNGAVGSVDTFNSNNATWHYSDQSVDNAFQKAMYAHNDYSFLRNLTTEQLLKKKENLEREMDAELRALQTRYHTKRQAILDAIAEKKQREGEEAKFNALQKGNGNT